MSAIVSLYGQPPQKRLWAGSWELPQPHSHNWLGSSYSHLCKEDSPGRPPFHASLLVPWGAGGTRGSGWTIFKACVALVGR